MFLYLFYFLLILLFYHFSFNYEEYLKSCFNLKLLNMRNINILKNMNSYYTF